MTRLSRIHPYPAMIADELAIELSERFVKKRSVVVDPFCGTGRTVMAAANLGAVCIGIDINPLAILVTKAKSCNPDLRCLEELQRDMESLKLSCTESSRILNWQEPGRRVRWFSKRCESELTQIVEFINARHLGAVELTIIATLLSATVREVSFARKDGWKLHRMSLKVRRRFYKCAKKEFIRRLSDLIAELRVSGKIRGEISAVNGDCRQLSMVLQSCSVKGCDLILCSPPYGDSRTTVQYGAMSALSLGVLNNLKGLNLGAFSGGELDRNCLGGQVNMAAELQAAKISKYWQGGLKNPGMKRVRSFLEDLDTCCREMAEVLHPSGRVVIVMSRRLVQGWRLRSDEFITDKMAGNGLRLRHKWMRTIQGKRIPHTINSWGRVTFKGRKVPTMRKEYVLVFSR